MLFYNETYLRRVGTTKLDETTYSSVMVVAFWTCGLITLILFNCNFIHLKSLIIRNS